MLKLWSIINSRVCKIISYDCKFRGGTLASLLFGETLFMVRRLSQLVSDLPLEVGSIMLALLFSNSRLRGKSAFISVFLGELATT